MSDIKLNAKDKRILAVLLIDASNLSAFTIMKLSRAGSGHAYVLLAKLEKEGLVSSTWEDGPEPRRCFYRLTPEGNAWAMDVLGLVD